MARGHASSIKIGRMICILAVMFCSVCSVIMPLSACTPSGQEVPQGQQAPQGTDAAAAPTTGPATGAAAGEAPATDSPAYAFRVAGTHLQPERWVIYEEGLALSLLMVEPDAPAVVTPFGTVSDFQVKVDWGSGAASDPFAVRFERLDGTDGYAARATFFYDGLSPEADLETSVGNAESLLYGGPDGSSYTYRLDPLTESLPVAHAADGDTWPQIAPGEQPTLPMGAQTIPVAEPLELSAGYYMLHDSLDEWVCGLFGDCYRKLADSGSLALPGEDGPNGLFVFDGGFNIVYTDAETGARLGGDLAIPLYDVMYYYGDHTLEGGSGVQLNPYAEDGGEGAQYPLFYPVTYSIAGFDYDTFDLPEKGFAHKFADSFQGCRYVLAYRCMTSRVDEAFYMGDIDRKPATTLVFVMDAQAREFVHIKSVGTDVPSGSTTSPLGGLLYEEARAYMDELVSSEP